MDVDVLRELVLPRLEKVRPSGGSFMAQCPAHDDGKNSLSVSVGKDQPVVLHCHAGCSTNDILVKLGLSWEDLSVTREERPIGFGEWTPAGPAVAVYDYRDEDDNLLFQVLRTANKDFRQRVPDPSAKSGWIWKLGDVRRVLYRLPTVIQAVRDGREIWITEGEKDAHSLEREGLVATCNSGGAGKWRPEYSEVLRDAVVTIVADRDQPGQAHARMVRDSLIGVAAYVRVVEAVQGKDITDHLSAGHTLAELTETSNSDEQSIEASLAPDLWDFLAVKEESYDWIVPGLLERGDRLMLTGYEGLGKSMLIRQMAVAIAAGLNPFTFSSFGMQPRKVLLIDCENSERQSRRKFHPIADASIASGYRVPPGNLRIIHRPEGIDLTREDDAAWLVERVTAHKPDVVFIGPFYRLHAANMNDELPARRAIAVLDLARTRGNCAMIIETHSGHGESGMRNVRPVGSSLLLRWPEFGFGLRPAMEGGQRIPDRVELEHWRGARDERDWPVALERGRNRWPWVVYS